MFRSLSLNSENNYIIEQDMNNDEQKNKHENNEAVSSNA